MSRRAFTITRMRVVDGYFEAYVTVNGDPPIHVDRRYGSWQADVRVAKGSQQFTRREVTREVAAALQNKARSMERTVTCPVCKEPPGHNCKGVLTTHHERVRSLEQSAQAEKFVDLKPHNTPATPDERKRAMAMAEKAPLIVAHDPPPNPAKLSDSRGADYVERFGHSSWELDALDPATMVSLIQSNVRRYRDNERWEKSIEQEREDGTVLRTLHENWDKAREYALANLTDNDTEEE